jgi:serine/threonine-protein kinase
MLTELDLNAKVKATEYSEDISLNHIIFQDPEAGTEIKKGRNIKFVISKGTRFIQMPDLRLMSLRKALIKLEEKGVCQGNLAKTHNEEVEKESIIAQVPSADSWIERAQCVDLLISAGAPQPAYKMPKLTGLFFEKAVMQIAQRQLALGAVRFNPKKYYPQNAVVSQEPRFGMRVPQSTPVNLVINRSATDGSASFSKPITNASVFKHRVNCGYLNKRVQIKIKRQHLVTNLFDSHVDPCQEILLFVPNSNQATLYVYEDDQLIKIQNMDVN